MNAAQEELKKTVARFPHHPGVYLMKDVEGEILYVGKARDLQVRVRSYLAGGDGRVQIEFLMRRVVSIETIVCESESQAFILERDLILRHKPRYNIKLKDDKAYLSVRIDTRKQWPRLELVRRIDDSDGAEYFGPYSYSYEVKNVLEVIKNVLPLRTCSDPVFVNRQRPCLEYQIKRCSGPCCLPVDNSQYKDWVNQAIAILRGKTTGTVKYLNERMEEASEALRFEEAAALRDRIEILERFTNNQQLFFAREDTRDAFAMYREGENVALSVLRVRGGRIAESENFSLTGVLIPDEEVLESAVSQYYFGGRDIPDEILLSIDLQGIHPLREALHAARGGAVEILIPQRGSKARLLNLAELNARQYFSQKFDSELRYISAAKKLQSVARLTQMPRRIECIDISNLQGSDIVGALVTFFDGSPQKSEYRKYKISFQEKPDDFAAIYEVVTRRLTDAMNTGEFPDVLVIDGGKGQLQMALQARDDLGVEQEIFSIAKMRTERAVEKLEISRKPERIFLEGEEESIPLEEGDEVTNLLQKIRDEVHRYVITFHRTKRAARVFRSVLDEVSGLGPERKKRLMQHYGSVHGMKTAPVEEIARVGRMSRAIAEKVLYAIGEKTEESKQSDSGV